MLNKIAFNTSRSDLDKAVAEILPTITTETIALENGAEAYFIRSSLLDPN